MKTTSAMFMPTLNASSSVCETAWPRNRKTISPCFVPAPPGVAGKSVASESTTSASSALWRLAWTPKARGRSRARAMRKHPGERLREDHAAKASRRRCPRIAKPLPNAGANSSSALDAQTNADHERPRGAAASPISVWRAVREEEPPVDGRQPRVDLVRRQHADRERPDDQRARDEEVEQRLGDQRRRERRVASSPGSGA